MIVHTKTTINAIHSKIIPAICLVSNPVLIATGIGSVSSVVTLVCVS